MWKKKNWPQENALPNRKNWPTNQCSKSSGRKALLGGGEQNKKQNPGMLEDYLEAAKPLLLRVLNRGGVWGEHSERVASEHSSFCKAEVMGQAAVYGGTKLPNMGRPINLGTDHLQHCVHQLLLSVL